MLIVAGRVPVKPERRAEAVAAAVKMAKATQAEAGCRSSDPPRGEVQPA